MRVWQIRAVLCRVALSNLRSVTHHIYQILSSGAIFCCSSYIHVAYARTWLPIQARGCPAGRCCSSDSSTTTTAEWAEIVHIVFLTMATGVRFSQAAKNGQQYVRISYLPAVVVVVHLMHHAHCCLCCEATIYTLTLLYVWYPTEAGGFFLCLNTKRDEYDSHYFFVQVRIRHEHNKSYNKQ